LAALASERAGRADDDAAARLIAGTVRDELATEQLRDLTTDAEITNYGTSHRNAT
jgi:hypothetical protein